MTVNKGVSLAVEYLEKYLPMAINNKGCLGADIVSPATACPAIEGTGSLSHKKTHLSSTWEYSSLSIK